MKFYKYPWEKWDRPRKWYISPDAIMTIDQVEAERRKEAAMSRSWKCEACGWIGPYREIKHVEGLIEGNQGLHSATWESCPACEARQQLNPVPATQETDT